MGFTPLKKSSLGSGKRKVDVKKNNVPYRYNEVYNFLKCLVTRGSQVKESSWHIATFYFSMHLDKGIQMILASE